MADIDVSWKERRVAAINRISKRKGWPTSDQNPYFDQFNVINNPKI